MSRRDDTRRSTCRTTLGVLAAGLLCLGFVPAVPAQGAALEQVAHFGGILGVPTPPDNFPGEEQLGGTGGMAINYTGAGGVVPGTVYVATKDLAEPTRIAVFKPTAGGLEFSYGWEVKEEEGAYERCGPDLVPKSKCPTRVESLPGFVDVEVDQSTGNVYVKTETITVGLMTIAAFTPEGEEVLSRFGEIGALGQTTATTPDKIHNSLFGAGIAVNEDGEVYIYDRNGFDFNFERLMKFVPKVPGDYTQYEYAGTGSDVASGFITEPTRPAMDAAGNLYVMSQSGNNIRMYDPENPGDPAVCEYKPSKGGATAIAVNPLSGDLYFFNFRKETGFTFKTVSQMGPCDPETGLFGTGEVISRVEVSPERDDLSALAFDPNREFSPTRPPGVLYGVAPGAEPSSGFGTGEPGRGSLGYIFAPKEESPPEVEAQSVSKVTAKSAQLHATIAPNGFKTRYVFQYLSEAAYQEAGETFAGASEAPAGEAFLDGTGEPQSAGVTLTGLVPDTAYRYRAVASSKCAPEELEKVCEDAGEAQSFRTYPTGSGALADNRAYELVSPANKNGGQVFPADPRIFSCAVKCISKPGSTFEHFPMQSAPNGDSVAYEGFSFEPGAGIPRENEYVARRGSTGWQSTQLTSTAGGNYKALDTALAEAALQGDGSLSPNAPPDYSNVYAQAVADPFSFEPLVTSEPPNRPANEFQIRFAAAAADLSRVFFSANDALTEETAVAPEAEDGGKDKFNLYEWERATGQLRLVNVLPGNTETEAGAAFGIGGSANTVSADGSRAFFSDGGGQLYVREGAAETREIPDPGEFLSASTDGSKLLLDNGHLYDLVADETTDLAEGKGGFLGLTGQSDDLSQIYFVDTAVLSEDENSEGDKAVAGKPNLYAWEGGVADFVATLLAGDNSGTNLTFSKAWSPFPSSRTAEASPAGRFLSFLSQAQPTGYDSTGPCESDHAEGFVDAPCPEVFLYDSVTGELDCASCNPSGARPLGSSMVRMIAGAPATSPQPRYLTDSGRLYFDSQDSLSPFDTNEGVEDVYEFEPEGIGGCKRTGGCVALLSAGREEIDSNFLAADASGKNIFFTSRDRLVGADKDELIDLYDIREGGGFEEALGPGPCTEGCQPLSPAAADTPPLSETLTDPGNVKPAKKCKKGQVKKKGKCVKKKQKQKPSKAKKRNPGGAE
ncbi:MAG TPA: hypothetical protein VMS60_00720 [Solirubrobacterales bacterium]|nr:hypothetical protein [Solirubrobacterales bacterium]